MNKKVIGLSFFLLLAVMAFPSEWALHFNFNYSSGLSDFFKLSQTFINTGSGTDMQKISNKLGWGFNAGIQIPVVERVSVIPSLAVNFGYQKNEYFPNQNENLAVRKNHYFRFISGNLNIAYDYLLLNNGWSSYLLTGFSLNSPYGDAEIGFSKSSYLGWQAGLGFRFRQLKNLGFNTLLFYKTFFGDAKISYVGLDLGLFYRF
jgi:hypothetical protein